MLGRVELELGYIHLGSGRFKSSEKSVFNFIVLAVMGLFSK